MKIMSGLSGVCWSVLVVLVMWQGSWAVPTPGDPPHGKGVHGVDPDFVRQRLTFKGLPLEKGAFQWDARATEGGLEFVCKPLGKGASPAQVSLHAPRALGGNRWYWFLTGDKGAVPEVLPLAYDRLNGGWVHISEAPIAHALAFETESPQTLTRFDTRYHGCHVGGDTPFYTPDTHRYAALPTDGKIHVGNRSCASCHSISTPLGPMPEPGTPLFDTQDLGTLEHLDFYEDGRNRSASDVMVSWSISPCGRGGKLACGDCHDATGAFLHKKEPDLACTGCHREQGAEKQTHTRHAFAKQGSPRCIDCHMPEEPLGSLMGRDHSRRPPSPYLSGTHGSSLACFACHTDQTLGWAGEALGETQPTKAPWDLIAAARRGDAGALPRIYGAISDPQSNEIIAASLLRMVDGVQDPARWDATLKAMDHPSALVRSAAATALEGHGAQQSCSALVAACQDPVRLVRVRAAFSLAGKPVALGEGKLKTAVDGAMKELEVSLVCQKDQWGGAYRLGQLYQKQKKPERALEAYLEALALNPRALGPMVNAALIHGKLGQLGDALALLERAHGLVPTDAGVVYNLALVNMELGHRKAASDQFARAVQLNPRFHRALFNLAVLASSHAPDEAVSFSERAYALDPNPEYAFTLAYYLNQNGEVDLAFQTLKQGIHRWPGYPDFYFLMERLAQRQDQKLWLHTKLTESLAEQAWPLPLQQRFEKMRVACGTGDERKASLDR